MISLFDMRWATIRTWARELGAAHGGFDLEEMISARKQSSLLPRRLFDSERIDDRKRNQSQMKVARNSRG